MVPDFYKLLANHQLIGYNLAYLRKPSWNIEGFFQPALDKPDPYSFQIWAYVPDTWPDTDFLCLLQPLL